MQWHLVVLVLVANARAGPFEDDESRNILANTRWVSSCFSSASQLESWKGSMLGCLLMLLIAYRFVRPLPQLQWWFGLRFVGSYQTLNKHSLYSFFLAKCQWTHNLENITNLKHGLLSIIFVIFLYANERIVLGLLQHRFCLSSFMCLLHSSMVQRKDNLLQKISE